MSSGFISETEIAERRRVRQEEWEKVRQPNQPLEAPEEEYDPRSLFERLEEQKKKKELEYEETHKLKNMIKGLDDDEIEFLDLVDRSKLEEEKKKSEEERREIADFRNKVASLHEQSLEQRIQQEIRQPFRINNNIKSGRTSQTKLLAGAVIKKRPSETKSEAKENPKRLRPLSEDNNNEGVDSGERVSVTAEHEEPKAGSLTCIGILPGVGNYDISSDESDCSTDIEDDKVRYDLLGRRIKKKCGSEGDSSNNENCGGLSIENLASSDDD
ncbi:PSME3-interacting protein isoform X2 [Halyomorpha halys]|uniref:PSME3-interacting protein isoform X2 n=1 Tax=Halyomorpha halys TaxID=286706 RepID=UPI0006D51F30|nr:protein FAM192A-like isoform X2 [Halyomorpha halys]